MTTASNPASRPEADYAVIFDMDGVLIDSARPHFSSWQCLADEHGATVSEQLFAATFGRQNRDIIPMIFGQVSPDRLVQLAERKEHIYRELIREQPPIVPGAIELIEALFAAGVPLAVGSSGPLENIEQVLKAMGVRSKIPTIISAADVTRGKPDPQVFQLACRQLGMPPARCAVIEDAPVGVLAAKSAGARAVAVLMHHPRSAFSDADLIVERLDQLSVDRLRDICR